jgi:hypothetical protein
MTLSRELWLNCEKLPGWPPPSLRYLSVWQEMIEHVSNGQNSCMTRQGPHGGIPLHTMAICLTGTTHDEMVKWLLQPGSLKAINEYMKRQNVVVVSVTAPTRYNQIFRCVSECLFR